MFEQFCEIVDTEQNINGVMVTRNLLPWHLDSVVDGYWPNWVFYNIDLEVPYALVLYVPIDNEQDIRFMIIGAKTDHWIDFETGIKMVMEGR